MPSLYCSGILARTDRGLSLDRISAPGNSIPQTRNVAREGTTTAGLRVADPAVYKGAHGRYEPEELPQGAPGYGAIRLSQPRRRGADAPAGGAADGGDGRGRLADR